MSTQCWDYKCIPHAYNFYMGVGVRSLSHHALNVSTATGTIYLAFSQSCWDQMR